MAGEHGRRLGKGNWSDPYDGAPHPDAPAPSDRYEHDPEPPPWDRFDPELDADLGPTPTRRKRGPT